MSGIGIALLVEGGVVSLAIITGLIIAVVLRHKDYTFSFTLLSAKVAPPTPAAKSKKSAAAQEPGAAGGSSPSAAPVPSARRLG